MKHAVYCLFFVLLVSGCKTAMVELGDNITYNQAHELDAAGKRKEAFRQYLLVAQDDSYSGAQSAQFRVAQGYLEADGTERNVRLGVQWLERAAAGPDVSWKRLAVNRLGRVYEQEAPEIGAPNLVEAASYYAHGTALGDESAAKSLARLEERPSVFVSRNESEFFSFSDEVAPYGMAKAYDLFRDGKHTEAHEIFLYHARRGNVSAQENVLVQYKEGLGVSKNDKLYAAWTYLAAKSGSAKAQHHMGILFREGEIVPGSDKRAIEWMVRAVGQGDAEALNSLGTVYARPYDKDLKKDEKKAFSYFKQAAERGSINAQVNLGDSYLHGIGTQKSRAAARENYIKAAKAGSLLARQRLFVEFDIVAQHGSADTAHAREHDEESSGQNTKPPEATRTALQVGRSGEGREGVASPGSRQLGAGALSLVEVFAKVSLSVYKLVALSGHTGGKSSGRSMTSQGSAVAISDELAITNCHVIDGMAVIGTVIDGEVVQFKLLSADKIKDLCVLRAEASLRPVGLFREYDELKVGEPVFAIGSPSGLDNTLSEGLISGLRIMDSVRHIQTTAPISPGSSGGGLFDSEGRLIGITTKGIDKGSLNFAVAIDEAYSLIE